MKHALALLALLATLGLAACDRQPVVSNPPPVVVTVPGPAGPLLCAVAVQLRLLCNLLDGMVAAGACWA